MSFGSHLRALREGASFSRAGLARRAGVPVSTLRNWEADRGMPGLPACLRLAEVLGVPVERFAEGVEDPAGEEGEATRKHVRRTNQTAGRVAVPSTGHNGDELPRAKHKPRRRSAQRPRT